MFGNHIYNMIFNQLDHNMFTVWIYNYHMDILMCIYIYIIIRMGTI